MWLVLYHTFSVAARGVPELLAILITIGVTLNVTVGSVSVERSMLIPGFAQDVVCALCFVWAAFAFVSDPHVARGPETHRAASPADAIDRIKPAVYNRAR